MIPDDRPVRRAQSSQGKADPHRRLPEQGGLQGRAFPSGCSRWPFPASSIRRSGKTPTSTWRRCSSRQGHRVVTIASGGCNMLAYLTRSPAAIDAVDLNAAHIALNRLKLAAFRHLPSHADLFRFFGEAGNRHNGAAYDRFIAPNLDAASRRYWEKRSWRGKRRIARVREEFLSHRAARPVHRAGPSRRPPLRRQSGRHHEGERHATSSAASSRSSWRRCSTAG